MAGILVVREHAELDRRCEPQLGTAHEARDVLPAAGGGDLIQHWPRGRQPALLDRVAVEISAVEVAELAGVAARGGLRRQGLQNLAHLLQRALAQQRERTPAGPIRRDLRGVVPVAVAITLEVIAGLHAGITARQIEPEGTDLRVVRRRRAAMARRVRGCSAARRTRASGSGSSGRQHGNDKEPCVQHGPFPPQVAYANSSQAPIHASPPTGVSTPSTRGAPRLSEYRLPENNTTPATSSSAARRSGPAS